MKQLLPILLAAVLPLGACNSNPPQEAACTLPQGNDLEHSMSEARFDLGSGCESRFEDYWQSLLKTAAGNPGADRKRQFSELLSWSVDQGLLSRRQAQARYNRYFNVKYVSLMGDFSVCSDTCPNRQEVLRGMRRELEDKKLGLLEIGGDQDGYRRAGRLLQESELVLEATCSACAGQ